MPPYRGYPQQGHPSPEVTDAICRVPSTSLSQSPKYTLPTYLCRFAVRPICKSYFLEPHKQHPQSNKRIPPQQPVTTYRSRNINLVSIDYPFRTRLRDRLTLLRLTLNRKPQVFGGSVFHTPYATHVSICTSNTSTRPHGRPSTAYGTLRYHCHGNTRNNPHFRYATLAPVHLRRRKACLD